MSRLRTAFDTLASRGTPRGAGEVLSKATGSVGSPLFEPEVRIEKGEEIMVSTTIRRPQRPSWVAFAAAFGLVLAVGLVTVLVRPADVDTSQNVAGGGVANTAVPGATLPPVDSAPMTVPAGAGLSYYAYLPDLHLGWQATEDGGTNICWKTPETEGCQSDQFFAPDTVIVPNGSQVFVLTRPALGGGNSREAVVELSNGQTVTEVFTTPSGIAIAYARIDLPDGATALSATASS